MNDLQNNAVELYYIFFLVEDNVSFLDVLASDAGFVSFSLYSIDFVLVYIIVVLFLIRTLSGGKL